MHWKAKWAPFELKQVRLVSRSDFFRLTRRQVRINMVPFYIGIGLGVILVQGTMFISLKLHLDPGIFFSCLLIGAFVTLLGLLYLLYAWSRQPMERFRVHDSVLTWRRRSGPPDRVKEKGRIPIGHIQSFAVVRGEPGPGGAMQGIEFQTIDGPVTMPGSVEPWLDDLVAAIHHWNPEAVMGGD